MLRAIETYYKGYRFRSRLEARWAVFFDAMGWPYCYEHEGVILDDGTPYLPDFWLPDVQVWLEIKPVAPSKTERKAAYAFARAGQPYYVLYGNHARHGAFWVDEPYDAHHDGSWEWDNAYFARCRACPAGVYLVDDACGGTLVRPCMSDCKDVSYPYLTDDIRHAYIMAKSARFEHGEKPRNY